MGCKKEILYYDSGEALEQVTQRSCGWSFPGNVQGQVGRGFEQPGPSRRCPSLQQGGWN